MTDHVRIVTSTPGKNRKRWTAVPNVADWETFVAWLVSGDGGGGKYGRPYSPVTLKEAPGRRKNVNLEARHVLTLDADAAGTDYLDRLDAALPFESLSHTTASHAPDAPRWRTLVPLSRPAAPAEAKALADHLTRMVGRERFDVQASTSPVAVAYAPAWDGVEYHKHDGPVLDVDDWLAVAPPVEWSPGDAAGAATVAEFLDEHAVADLADLPGCPYGREALAGVLADLEGTPEGGGVHRAVFNAACRSVEMVQAGCWSVRDVDRLEEAAADLRAERREHEFAEALTGALRKGCLPDEGCREHGAAAAADVFDATPVLRQVRQAAHSRMVSPRGLLLCTLARLAVEVPRSTALPAVIGSKAPLNIGVALVAGSGGGKSVLFDVSRELLGLLGEAQRDVERVPGSGEGLIETFLGRPQDDGLGGKSRPVVPDPRRLFYVDEIGQLGAVKDGRSGSTVGPILRSMLTGGLLGTENATADRRRHVPAGAYRAALVAGVQPTASDVLLNDYDVGVGTPQRFVWTLTADPTLPDEDVEWPGPLAWREPREWPETFEYPEALKAEIRRQARQAARGEGDDSTRIDGHARLTRLKVAALLAVLHGETAITDLWWRLAGVVAGQWTEETVASARAALGRDRARKDRVTGESAGRRLVAQDDYVEDDRQRRAEVTGQVLVRLAEAGEDGVGRTELRRAFRRSREVFDRLVGTADDPGSLARSGQVRVEQVTVRGQAADRVYLGEA